MTRRRWLGAILIVFTLVPFGAACDELNPLGRSVVAGNESEQRILDLHHAADGALAAMFLATVIIGLTGVGFAVTAAIRSLVASGEAPVVVGVLAAAVFVAGVAVVVGRVGSQ